VRVAEVRTSQAPEVPWVLWGAVLMRSGWKKALVGQPKARSCPQITAGQPKLATPISVSLTDVSQNGKAQDVWVQSYLLEELARQHRRELLEATSRRSLGRTSGPRLRLFGRLRPEHASKVVVVAPPDLTVATTGRSALARGL